MFRSCAKVLFLLLFPLLLSADQLALSDGSLLNGTLKEISGGTILFATDFAGELRIPVEKAVTLHTEGSVQAVTKEGRRLSGKLEETPDASANQVSFSGENQTVGLTELQFLWSEGMEDPTLPKPREWNGELALNLAGKTGNNEKFNGGAAFKATLAGPHDALKFYGSALYGREDHSTNTKKYLCGADYEQDLKDSPLSWYGNAEFEKQTTSGLRLRQEAGTGMGYYFVKTEQMKLRLRAGITGKLQEHTDNTHNDTMGASVALFFQRDFSHWGKWETEIKYEPGLDRLDDCRILHESALDLPLSFQYPLELRLGVSNEYNGRVAEGKEHLDTYYFTKLVLKWK